MADSPFHEGEQRIQERLGVRDRVESIGRHVLRDFMPEQHRAFFAAQPYVFVGSVDAAKRPWASVLVGEPGFLASPDPQTLVIAATPFPGDVLADHLRPGASLGLLGIEPHTRRRNRLNGTVVESTSGRIVLHVEQSFGNCPKYINVRTLRRRPDRAATPAVAPRDLLHGRPRAIVERADTCFIATSHLPGAADRRYGVDVSHRGGRPGFVRLEADGSLAMPDYVGNFLFNTLGNIEQDRRAGLLFVDFDGGDLLQLTGEASIDWEAPEVGTAAGVQRLVRVRPMALRLTRGAFPFDGAVAEYAPQLDGIDAIRGAEHLR